MYIFKKEVTHERKGFWWLWEGPGLQNDKKDTCYLSLGHNYIVKSLKDYTHTETETPCGSVMCILDLR